MRTKWADIIEITTILLLCGKQTEIINATPKLYDQIQIM